MKALFDSLAVKKPVSTLMSLIAVVLLFVGGVMYDIEVGVLHIDSGGGGYLLAYLGAFLGLFALFGLVFEDHDSKK